MKAWVLYGADDLRYETVEDPMAEAGEVIVAVGAAGICGSDIPRIYETGAHRHPLIPGHEFAGEVVEVGAGVDTAWKGRRVGVFPLIPCGSCVACRKKQYEMCRNYSYLGSRRDGGFAEYVSVPVQNLLQLPDEVLIEEAAMLEPMAVAAHAMRRISPDCGDTVVICGLGTIGLLLLALLMEADIPKLLVIGNKDFQKQTVLGMGVPEEAYCDSRTQDVTQWVMERTDGIGADVFLECVGKNETIVQAIQGTAPAGKVMLVGNPHSDMKLEKSVYWSILRNQLQVMGTWNSSFLQEEEDDWQYVLARLARKRLMPSELITHRFALEELWKGLHIMRDKSEDYVKVMAEIDD